MGVRLVSIGQLNMAGKSIFPFFFFVVVVVFESEHNGKAY